MKFRKILSAVTALAMSASAVAGLAVTANAATEVVNEDFEHGTDGEGTTGTIASGASTGTVSLESGTWSATGYASKSLVELADAPSGAVGASGVTLHATKSDYNISEMVTMPYTVTADESFSIEFDLNMTPIGTTDNFFVIGTGTDNSVLKLGVTPSTTTTMNFDDSVTVTKNLLYYYDYETATFKSTGFTASSSQWLHVTAVYNRNSNSAKLTLVSNGDEETSVTYSINSVPQIAVSSFYFQGVRYEPVTGTVYKGGIDMYLDNIVINTLTDDDLDPTYEYTFEYKVGDTSVATITEKAESGKRVYAASSVEADDGSGTVYYYDGSEDGYNDISQYYIDVETDVEENYKAVPVRAEYTYTVNVTETAGGTSLGKYADVKESEGLTYYYPKYLTNSNHEVTAVCNAGSYSATADLSTADSDYNVECEVSYTAYDGDTMYFFEETDFEGASFAGTENSSALSSGGSGRLTANTSGSAEWNVEETAIYKVTFSAKNGRGAKDVYESISLYVNNGTTAFTSPSYISQVGYYTEDYVYLAFTEGDTSLKIANDTSSTTNLYIDYVLITKADPQITDVAVATAQSIADNTKLYEVDETNEDNYTAASGYDGTVTTYVIKVANWADGLAIPTLTIDESTILESKGTASEYVYAQNSDGYDYFMIQTVGLDRAATATFNGSDFTVPTE